MRSTHSESPLCSCWAAWAEGQGILYQKPVALVNTAVAEDGRGVYRACQGVNREPLSAL